MDVAHVPAAATAYLERIGRIPLLTVEDELALGTRVRAGRCSDDPAVVADGRAAHASLVRANLRLVVAQVRRLPVAATSFLDVVQEGNVGLMQAAERFDPARGCKFSTYAHDWIAQAIWSAVASDRLVRLPARAGTRLAQCRRAREDLRAGRPVEPAVDDVARQVGLSVAHVRSLLRADESCLPLEQAVLVAADDDPSAPAERRDRCARVRGALARLDAEERCVVELRFGLAGEACSIVETARRSGIEVARVRALERRALETLRASGDLAALR